MAVTVRGNEIICDYTGSSPQVKGPINATFGVCASQTYSAIFQVTDPHIPTNHGCFRPIRLIAPPGTVVNADYPAATFGGNVETSTRIVDVVLGAMAKAVPERSAAACYGTCQNFTCGSMHHETDEFVIFYLYEEGGWGGRAALDGNPALISPIGNDHNQPVEIFENKFPWLYEAYELVDDSGGPGRRRGGTGVRQVLRLLAPEARINLIADRFTRAPYGLFGGLSPVPHTGPGHWNAFRVKRKGSGGWQRATELWGTTSPSKFANRLIYEGDHIEYSTTGGGGYGNPFEREVELVLEDVRNEMVSVENARKCYGVVVDPETLELDREATDALRARGRSE